MLIRLLFLILTVLIFSCSETKKEQENINSEIQIAFAGDLLLDRGVRKEIELKGVEHLFTGTKDLFSQTDFSVANLECPATRDSTPINKKYIFRAEPEWLKAIFNAGITHLSMANNHFNDQGRKGASDTYEAIISESLVPTGFGKNMEEACKPVILKKNGETIAVFSTVTVALENWMVLDDRPGACQMGLTSLIGNITSYKESHPKHNIVVFIHWGMENLDLPDNRQREEAKLIIEAGADAIIGHHPHVIQSVDFFNGKPVFYSIGNFIFDQSQKKQTQGIIPVLTFKDNQLKEIEVYPFNIIKATPILMNNDESKVLFGRIDKLSPKNELSFAEGVWIWKSTE